MGRIVYTPRDIAHLVADMSRGGHPDDFVPYSAHVSMRGINGKPRVVIYWDESHVARDEKNRKRREARRARAR